MTSSGCRGPGRELRDDLGAALTLTGDVDRVVSLVPSLTESVARTARDLLVGATDWCTEPPDLDVFRVGGTKSPDIDRVVALRPDVVLANEEENRAADIEELRAHGLAVWVTAPRTVADALSSLDRMFAACGLPAPRWLLEAAEVWRAPYAGARVRAFVPIWRRPWMSLGRDTFAGDILRLLGVDHVFADDASRYPRVDLDDARNRHPDLVVLPDEPYAFTAEEGVEVFGGWQLPVVPVSGRDLTWYGPSLVTARAALEAALSGARAVRS